jgi:hypothetical protein
VIVFDQDAGVYTLRNGTEAERSELDAKLVRVAPGEERWWPPGVIRAPVRGLGDVVARVTDALGIKKCGGCAKRQKKLNDLFPL